jgi:hypothetical protein
MADDHDSDRHERIEALHEAARLERAQTLRRLLQGLLRGRATAELWPSRRALGEGS